MSESEGYSWDAYKRASERDFSKPLARLIGLVWLAVGIGALALEPVVAYASFGLASVHGVAPASLARPLRLESHALRTLWLAALRAVFWCIVVPIAALRKLLHSDPLGLCLDRSADSYWGGGAS